MSDEMGADPGRVAKAAAALEQVRDALAEDVPVIVRTLNQYWSSGTGSPAGLSPLPRTRARSVEDASKPRIRQSLSRRVSQRS